MREVQSAVVVEVPEAEAAVAALRRRYDPVAAHGVPAHVTLLFPFVRPDRLHEPVVAAVADVVARRPRFEYALSRLGEFPDVVWLAPDPAAPFAALTDALVARFPEQPPYGGRFSETVPHLTVAMTEGRDHDAVCDEVRAALEGALPIRARATHVSLLTSDTEGIWGRVASFPLGRRAGSGEVAADQ